MPREQEPSNSVAAAHHGILLTSAKLTDILESQRRGNKHNSGGIMIAAIFIGIFVVLVVIAVFGARRRGASTSTFIKDKGFIPCPEKENVIKARVNAVENNSMYQYGIHKPHRAMLNGRNVYWYSRTRARASEIHDVNSMSFAEFLVEIPRPSDNPLIIYVKPSEVTGGIALSLLEKTLSMNLTSHPPDVTRFPSPSHVSYRNILAVFGKEGVSLYDLISDELLRLIDKAGDSGVFCDFSWQRLPCKLHAGGSPLHHGSSVKFCR